MKNEEPGSNIASAVDWLFERSGRLKPRRDKTYAYQIVEKAYQTGVLVREISDLTAGSEPDEIESIEIICKKAGKSAKDLSLLLETLRDKAPYKLEDNEDERLLVRSLCHAMGLHPTDDSKTAAELVRCLKSAATSLETIVSRTTTFKQELTGGRSRFSSASVPISELAYAWTDIIGKPPRRGNQQDTSTFGEFIYLLLNKAEERQIRNAVNGLNPDRVEKTLELGYEPL